MDYNTANQSLNMAGNYAAEPLNRYVAKTFGWMFAGLLTTFLISVIGYATGAIILVFGATSLFFGIMALLGHFTNADFSRVRPFLMGGLVFLLVFWVLSMFLNLSAFETAVCYIGIFIFLAFTAYDTQKIKAYHQYYSQNPAMAAKASIFSALQLYLDFVNLFLYLIRLMGRRK